MKNKQINKLFVELDIKKIDAITMHWIYTLNYGNNHRIVNDMQFHQNVFDLFPNDKTLIEITSRVLVNDLNNMERIFVRALHFSEMQSLNFIEALHFRIFIELSAPYVLKIDKESTYRVHQVNSITERSFEYLAAFWKSLLNNDVSEICRVASLLAWQISNADDFFSQVIQTSIDLLVLKKKYIVFLRDIAANPAKYNEEIDFYNDTFSHFDEDINEIYSSVNNDPNSKSIKNNGNSDTKRPSFPILEEHRGSCGEVNTTISKLRKQNQLFSPDLTRSGRTSHFTDFVMIASKVDKFQLPYQRGVSIFLYVFTIVLSLISATIIVFIILYYHRLYLRSQEIREEYINIQNMYIFITSVIQIKLSDFLNFTSNVVYDKNYVPPALFYEDPSFKDNFEMIISFTEENYSSFSELVLSDSIYHVAKALTNIVNLQIELQKTNIDLYKTQDNNRRHFFVIAMYVFYSFSGVTFFVILICCIFLKHIINEFMISLLSIPMNELSRQFKLSKKKCNKYPKNLESQPFVGSTQSYNESKKHHNFSITQSFLMVLMASWFALLIVNIFVHFSERALLNNTASVGYSLINQMIAVPCMVSELYTMLSVFGNQSRRDLLYEFSFSISILDTLVDSESNALISKENFPKVVVPVTDTIIYPPSNVTIGVIGISSIETVSFYSLEFLISFLNKKLRFSNTESEVFFSSLDNVLLANEAYLDNGYWINFANAVGIIFLIFITLLTIILVNIVIFWKIFDLTQFIKIISRIVALIPQNSPFINESGFVYQKINNSLTDKIINKLPMGFLTVTSSASSSITENKMIDTNEIKYRNSSFNTLILNNPILDLNSSTLDDNSVENEDNKKMEINQDLIEVLQKPLNQFPYHPLDHPFPGDNFVLLYDRSELYRLDNENKELNKEINYISDRLLPKPFVRRCHKKETQSFMITHGTYIEIVFKSNSDGSETQSSKLRRIKQIVQNSESFLFFNESVYRPFLLFGSLDTKLNTRFQNRDALQIAIKIFETFKPGIKIAVLSGGPFFCKVWNGRYLQIHGRTALQSAALLRSAQMGELIVDYNSNKTILDKHSNYERKGLVKVDDEMLEFIATSVEGGIQCL